MLILTCFLAVIVAATKQNQKNSPNTAQMQRFNLGMRIHFGAFSRYTMTLNSKSSNVSNRTQITVKFDKVQLELYCATYTNV